jgi:hypothetical protein
MVYKVPPGDIFANNYGRGHMKPSHQVSYDMRLPPNKKIPVKNDQYIQGTPWPRQFLAGKTATVVANIQRPPLPCTYYFVKSGQDLGLGGLGSHGGPAYDYIFKL